MLYLELYKLTALGALLAGGAGIITAWAALVRARKEGEADCENRVAALREEAEQVADELHELRMKRSAG